MDKEQIKKVLRIAVNVGCGFEGDAEDAKGLLDYIAALESENAKLNATIDRTVNAWESRCIEKYDEIERLKGWLDELMEYGKPRLYWQQGWDELVARIQKEREE